MRLLTIIGSLIALALALVAALGNASAPQQAALAGMALCSAVIPYVLLRVQQLGQQAEREAQRHQEIVAILKAHQTPPAQEPSL